MWTALGADRHSLLVRVFDASWLRFLGRYSYSLYLLHLFVMRGLERTPIAPNRVGTVGGHATPALALFAVATIAVSCLLALVSWRLVEGPALRLKRYFPTGRRLRRSKLPPPTPSTARCHRRVRRPCACTCPRSTACAGSRS